jgi:hypothetical protein
VLLRVRAQGFRLSLFDWRGNNKRSDGSDKGKRDVSEVSRSPLRTSVEMSKTRIGGW